MWEAHFKRFNKRSQPRVYKLSPLRRSLVISRENLIKKDVTNLATSLPSKNIALKNVPYANIDSRDSMVASYDSCAGEPSETV